MDGVLISASTSIVVFEPANLLEGDFDWCSESTRAKLRIEPELVWLVSKQASPVENVLKRGF